MTEYSSDLKIVRPYTIGDAQLLSTNATESVAVYNVGTTYAKGDLARQGERVYQSQQASNTDHALSDIAWWIDVGPSNKMAMFDLINGTQTVMPTAVATEVEITGRVDFIALLNIQASTVDIVAETADRGEIFNETFALVDYTEIVDYWEYCFSDVVRKTELYVPNFPIDYLPKITITISNPGGDAKVGTQFVGWSKTLGVTSLGLELGILDFSFKQRTIFGDWQVVERPYADKVSFKALADNNRLDGIMAVLRTYRAIPCLWIGTDRYNAAAVFGFYLDATVTVSYPEHSEINLRVEGLT